MTDATPQDKALQKKLVGAAVLIGLAVIFLPMLFDGKKDDTPVSMQIEIPPKPVYDIPNRLERGAESGAPAAATTPPVQTIAIAPEPVEPATAVPAQPDEPPAAAKEPAKAETAKQEPARQPAEKAKPARSEKPAARKAEQPKAARQASKPKQVKPAAAGGAGYVVQVGSFSQKANADTLTSKLKAKGFPAFVEGTRAGGKSIYRVKVGPRPTREAADDLRQRLIDKARLEGIIVSHH